MGNHWSPSGDLVLQGTGEHDEPTTFRPVGYLINGGPMDGMMVAEITDAIKAVRHGSFSPLYIEIGD